MARNCNHQLNSAALRSRLGPIEDRRPSNEGETRMYYGLDFSEVRYETDHTGNKLKATIPYPMFSALIEFWREARRAQTASLETKSRPGQFKGSLPSLPEP